MRLEIHGHSDSGRLKRNNEDCLDYLLAPGRDAALAVLADGVGGAPGGEQASRLAVDAAVRCLRGQLTGADSQAAVIEAVSAAQAAVGARQRQQPELAQMATTLVAVLAQAEQLVLAHVGDSRCYRLRGDELVLLTEDHTVAQQMLAEGRLPADALANSPYHHVLTRALGVNEPRPDTSVHALEAGDVYLLCSDGLSNELSEPQMAALIQEGGGLERVAPRLIDAANAAGGRDNISVVLLAAG